MAKSAGPEAPAGPLGCHAASPPALGHTALSQRLKRFLPGSRIYKMFRERLL